MNKVELTGRLTADPEVRYSTKQDGTQTAIARFTLACDRRRKQEGQPTADFIRCGVFGSPAEFVEKYFKKGMKMELSGRIQTGSYKNQEGATVYTTEVIGEEIGFAESKGNQGETPTQQSQGGFMSIPEGAEEELPWA